MNYKLLIMALLLLAPFFLQAQKTTLIFYESQGGRPMAFEYNNARKVVHRRWKMEYRSPQGVDTSDVRLHNTRSAEAMEQRHGKNWNSKLQAAIKMELSEQSKMRLWIKKEGDFKELNLSEPIIELQPKGRKKYIAKVVAQQNQGDRKPFVIYQVYVIKPAKEKVRRKGKKTRPLDFEYPENGLTNSK